MIAMAGGATGRAPGFCQPARVQTLLEGNKRFVMTAATKRGLFLRTGYAVWRFATAGQPMCFAFAMARSAIEAAGLMRMVRNIFHGLLMAGATQFLRGVRWQQEWDK
jgi:hypothetical protein